MIEGFIISTQIKNKRFDWDVERDCGVLINIDNNAAIWQGSLLPSFEIVDKAGTLFYADAKVNHISCITTSYMISLDYGDFGVGTLNCEMESWGIRFSKLSVTWSRPTRIIALYFGLRRMTAAEMQRAPRLDKPFWPDWSSEGYCIPCASSCPTKSFWRSWDMGDAILPLGSFGDAMGTPYAAAYPRPLYAAAVGGKNGWGCFGPGEIPDAPLSLKLQAATSCLQYLYREDLWTASNEIERIWREPLRFAWGDNGYDAYVQLYQSFPTAGAKAPHHLRSFLCTWGEFKEGRYNLKHFSDRAAQTTPADIIILDDYWETFDSSGKPNYALFPNFDEDLKYIEEMGYQIGLWQSITWVDRPEEFGLTNDDLLCGIDGKPRLWAWSGNPLSNRNYHYCLDPSSENAQRFIIERTRNIVTQFNPVALKLDFGYGVPGPDICTPRNPELRGERLCVELLKLISTTAKEINPQITIIYYGLHPLLHDYFDMLNLDDLGDAGDSAEYERIGHNQRCMWAALAAQHGMAINTSTGYYADALESILLDTAVVGVNGLTLGEYDHAGKKLNLKQLNRWHAMNCWRRRTCGWKPLWLDAEMGDMGREPAITSWGRVESTDEMDAITALTLRNKTKEMKAFVEVDYLAFTGEWALISQDNKDISITTQLVCIPFSEGTITLNRSFEAIEIHQFDDNRMQCVKTITKNQLPYLELTVSEEELSQIVGFVIIY
jgi:hypothetical protein